MYPIFSRKKLYTKNNDCNNFMYFKRLNYYYAELMNRTAFQSPVVADNFLKNKMKYYYPNIKDHFALNSRFGINKKRQLKQ